MSIKNKILTAPDRKSDDLTIPEWDVTVLVYGMGGRLRAKLITAYQEAGIGADNADQGAVAKVLIPMFPEIVADCLFEVVDGKAVPVFGPADIDDLSDKSGEVLQTIAMKAIELSGLGAGAVDEAGKPSSETAS